MQLELLMEPNTSACLGVAYSIYDPCLHEVCPMLSSIKFLISYQKQKFTRPCKSLEETIQVCMQVIKATRVYKEWPPSSETNPTIEVNHISKSQEF